MRRGSRRILFPQRTAYVWYPNPSETTNQSTREVSDTVQVPHRNASWRQRVEQVLQDSTSSLLRVNPIVHDDTAFVPNMMLINECSQPHHQPRFKLVHQLLELQSQRHFRTEYRHDTVIPFHGPSSCKNRNRVPRVRLSS